MEKFVSKYALAAHIALLAVAPLFLFQFFDTSVISATLLWLSLFAGSWLFLQPSHRKNEYLSVARERVFNGILKDPVFWSFILLLLISVVRYVNTTEGLVYDFEGAETWVLKPVEVEWLPGSIEGSALASLSTVVVLIVVTMAIRHALGKSARLMFAFCFSLFAGIAAMLAFRECCSGNVALIEMTQSNYSAAPFVGTGFGIAFVVGLVAASGIFERKWHKSLLAFALAIGSSFLGLLLFAAPITVVMYSIVGICLLIVCSVYLWLTAGLSAMFKYLATLVMAALIPFVCVSYFSSPELFASKKCILNFDLFPQGYFETRTLFHEMSLAEWQNNMWLGLGLGSFRSLVELNVEEINWVSYSFNGWSQLLLERGLIGLVEFILPLIIMLVFLIIRIVSSIGSRSFWPFGVLGVLILITVLIEVSFNCSFMRTEVVVATSAFLMLALSSFPLRNKENQQTKGEENG